MVQRSTPRQRAPSRIPKVAATTPPVGKSLETLRAFLKPGGTPDSLAHSLEQTSAGWTLKIGLLFREHKRFMALTTLAMREGSLKRIDAGYVVGPKVLGLLNRLRIEAEKKRLDVLVTGRFSPTNLNDLFKQELALAKPTSLAEGWSPDEVADYHQALRDLQVEPLIKPGWSPQKPLAFELVTKAGTTSITYREP